MSLALHSLRKGGDVMSLCGVNNKKTQTRVIIDCVKVEHKHNVVAIWNEWRPPPHPHLVDRSKGQGCCRRLTCINYTTACPVILISSSVMLAAEHTARRIKMNNVSSLPPTIQKWNQNISDTNADILCIWSQRLCSSDGNGAAGTRCSRYLRLTNHESVSAVDACFVFMESNN